MAVLPTELAQAAVASGLIDSSTAEALARQHRRTSELVEALTTRGRFPISALYRALAEKRGIPFVDLNTEPCDYDLVRRVPEALLRRRRIVPIGRDNGQTVVATADPDDRQTIQSLERILSAPSRVVLADPDAVEGVVRRALARPSADAVSEESPDVVALLDRVMKEAYLRRASDIHVEPQENGTRVRLRIDGRLHEYISDLDRTAGISLLSRIKVLSNLNIAEQRKPQDGRFSHQPPGTDGQSVDIRVATAPSRWGERATLRLLGTESTDFTLTRLGMSDRMLDQFREVIRRPYGMILLTGPTGSGKSTTLYASLREINQSHLNILTVEDPIEYVIPGVSQMHVGGTDKVTFASALRSLLRHDPDVMMVGEIRDLETADIAMKSAMTGHLIFSTLHTNTSCGAVTRLIDIGCEPYLVGSTLAAVIAQRLVRRLCPRCRHRRPATGQEARQLGRTDDDLEIYGPVGCANCLGSGYRGRIGLFEPLWIDREMARLISQGVGQPELEAHVAGQLTTLRADGADKVLQGLTSVEEVLRTTILEL